jgi:hypothetical protein
LTRVFATGATRDNDHDKLDFEGFLSPLVLEAYAEYMHEKRKMPDGSFRDSDNWQKGIPLDAYMKSKWRHFHDTWKNHRGLPAQDDIKTALLAEMFNTMGYLHEVLVAELKQTADEELKRQHPLLYVAPTPEEFVELFRGPAAPTATFAEPMPQENASMTANLGDWEGASSERF